MRDRNRFIHPQAVVHPSAMIGIGAFIGRGVVIGADVTIGTYSCIGGMPEHRDFFYDYGGVRNRGVVIEDGARVFEFCTIHGGTLRPTRIGPGVVVQNHSHVAHDCWLQEGSMIGGQVSLAGHTVLMPWAIVAGKSCTHQFSVLGPYSFLSAMSYLKGHVPPGEKWIGNPARHAGLNDIGLERAKLTHDDLLAKWSTDYGLLTRGTEV